MLRLTAWIPLALTSACAAEGVVAWLAPLPQPPSAQMSDCLGSSVATSGADILAGARGRDLPLDRCGEVAWWRRSGSAWNFQGWIASPRPAAGQEFGHALDMTTTHAVVGAPLDDARGTDSGAAWLLSLETGAPAVELSPSSSQAGERMGSAVSMSEAWVAVAAPAATVQGQVNAGRVVLIEQTGGSWVESAVIVAPTAAADMRFGEAVDLLGGWLAVGCPASDAADQDAGAVHLYQRHAAGWVHVAEIRSPAPAAYARFGQSVRLQPGRLLIGEPRASGGGRLHTFSLQDDRWVPLFVNQAGDAIRDWAWSATADGPWVLASGALGSQSGSMAGSVSLFHQDDAAAHALALPASPNAFALFGAAIDLSAGVAVIGSPGHGTDPLHAGAVFALDLGADCDADGRPDAVAVGAGAPDRNCDAVPDTCQCLADLDGDLEVSAADISLLLVQFGQEGACLAADLDTDGSVSAADISMILISFGACPDG